MELFIHFRFGIHRSAYLSTQRFPLTRSKARNMAAKC